MANPYQGETTITLNKIAYPMKVTLGVINAFTNETGTDFMTSATGALNAWAQADHEEKMGIDRAHHMCKAVPMKEAAYLFYLAAKECNSQVTLEEMQEAVLMEGPLNTEDNTTYPIAYINLVSFALIGPQDEKAKKISPES